MSDRRIDPMPDGTTLFQRRLLFHLHETDPRNRQPINDNGPSWAPTWLLAAVFFGSVVLLEFL